MMIAAKVAIGLGSLYLLFRKRSAVGSAGASVPFTTKQLIGIVTTQDPANSAQFDTNPANYVLVADQDGYQGWYRSTKDGSWYNPTTDEFYGGTASPPRYARYGQYGSGGTMTRPVIDLSTRAQTTGNETDPNAPTNPANGYVIY